MQSPCSPIHQPQSPSALSFFCAYRLTPICKSFNSIKNNERKNNMQRKYVSKKWIAFLLSLILVVGSLPINAIALGSNGAISSAAAIDSSELIADSQEHTDDEVIGEIVEITSLREENVKHFRLADGTYEAVFYTHPVHRKDKTGVWQDIDNNLSLANEGDLQKYRTSDSRVKFAESFKANAELFTLSENGYSISMTLVSNNMSSKLSSTAELQLGTESKPIVSNAPTRVAGKSFITIDEAATIDNRSSIVYNNVKANTSLEYILHGNDLKENIIVSAPCESYEYQFQMNLVGLRAELDNKGNILLYDLQNGLSQYIIPAPYMYDNAGEHSTAVSYELITIKDGAYLLNICADESWVNSTNRTFPVTIDPSISLDRVVWDSYTYLTYPDENYGYDEDLWVSNYRTSYIYMDIPELPDGATFNRAYLYVSYYYYISDGGLLAGAYQVLEDWDEGSITYNNAPAVSSTRLDKDILTASESITESSPGLACFIITDAVRDWYDDSNSNYGIAIKRESSTTYTNASVILKSYEAYDDDYAYISVNYTYYVPNGVYALQSDYSTTRWMTVEDDSVWAGNHIQQVYSASSPASTSVFDRSSLFKISRVSGTSRYIIRSMLNNNLSFGISGTEIITKEIPSADSDVAYADTFYIEWDGYGFLIRPYGSSNVIKMASTSTANLTTVAKSSANSYARWNLVQYTGAHKRGSTIYHPVTLNAGTTVTFTPVIWATNVDYNTPNLSVVSGYTDKATATWNASTRKGSFVLHDDGTLKVTSKIYNGSQSSSYSFTHTFTLTLVVDEGVYFIKNKEVGKYMQIDDNASPQYDENGAKMELWDFDGGDYQKWNLIHVGDGYYKLISVKSGLALSVQSGETNSDEQYLIQDTNSSLSRKKWKITKSSSGAYVFRPQSGESYATDWSMCAGDQFLWITDGLNVEQKAYTNDSNYKDEWILTAWSHTVQLEPQQQTNWCWAASARMSSMIDMQSSISQASAAVYVKLNVVTSNPTSTQISNANKGGTVGETEKALEHILDSNDCYSTWGNIYSESVLRKVLDSTNPVIILRGWYDTSGTRIGGHYVVIYDYYWDSNNNIYMYEIFDPWSPNVGDAYSRSYQSICNGRNAAFTGDVTDTGVWEGIVVYENGDYLNTISWPGP